MKKIFINDFNRYLGEEIQDFFYLKDIEYTDNGQGHRYQRCALCDKTGVRTGKVCSQYMNPTWNGYRKSVVQVTGRVEIFQDIYELSIYNIRQPASGEYNLLDFEPAIVENERVLLMNRFKELVHSVSNHSYHALLLKAYGNQSRFARLCELPAEWRYHHAYRGGWLEYMVDVVELALHLSDTRRSMRQRMFRRYVEPDRDLIVTGALLHDIGRLSTIHMGIEPRTTQRGYLVGAANDSIISVSALNNLLPREERIQDLTQLIHVVAGSMGEGSNVPPQTLEALLVAEAKHSIIQANSYYSMFAEFDYEHPDCGCEMVFSKYFGRQMMRGE